MPRKTNPRRSQRLRSLRVSDTFREYVVAQLEDLEDVTSRSMFGGVGLYRAGVFFGIVAGDILYLKVDEANRPDYERRGMGPFKPYPNRSSTMQYYAVPLDVLESSLDLVEWARKAVAAAARNRATPSRRR